MQHKVYRVVSFEPVGAYILRVAFDDGTQQMIDFTPILSGETYAPLQEKRLFDRVQIDPEVHTLVWPNGADFDPETLHDWPEHVDALKKLAAHWKQVSA